MGGWYLHFAEYFDADRSSCADNESNVSHASSDITGELRGSLYWENRNSQPNLIREKKVGKRETAPDGLLDIVHATAQGIIAGANLVLVDVNRTWPDLDRT